MLRPVITSAVFSAIYMVIGAILVLSTASAAGSLEVHDAWASETSSDPRMYAAYFTLHNHSAHTYILQQASLDDFKQVEIQRSVVKNTEIQRVPVHRMILSSGASIHFAPGGMYLMLTEPNRSLHSGDTISLSLEFTDHTRLNFTAPIQQQAMTHTTHTH